ncbi:MAG TPA: sulfite exporter TauE/SafE family protein [Methylomirabilota bacterium]|nr:sulfite exporter TauE/SafE family protein [Methylomirabilota bacterium]
MVATAVLLIAASAGAHPLGNFSISHYAGIDIEPDAVQLRYLIDMAEIPTFQEMQDTGLVAEVGHPSVAPWMTRMADKLQRGLRLEVGGRRLALAVTASEIIFPPGAGDLPTLKLGVVYRATLDRDAAGAGELSYADENFPSRAGWKEIVVRGRPGVTIVASTAPATDRSNALADYPTDLLNTPPQDLEARVTFTRDATVAAPAAVPSTPPATGEARAPPVGLQPNRQPRTSTAFTDLMTRSEPGAGLVAAALLVAVALGAFHALEPGHGKTVVAAYLVGSRGTVRHALVLGLVVTASHTAGVYLLGGVTFYASQHVVPERLYPWLSLGSGLTIAALGAALFLRRYAGAENTRGHHHGDHHHHHPHGHSHDHPHDHSHTHEPVSLRALVALGVSGGIIPCPAALVVLLSALSMRRVGFGLVLIVAFSVGLAAVLVAIGILMVYAGRLMSRVREDGPWIRRRLPLTSSAVMTLLGIGIAVQALASFGK